MIIDFFQSSEKLVQNNRGLVLSQILLNGPVPRATIAERIGLTPATVSRITRQLIELGIVEEGDAIDAPRPGRRFVSLKVRPSGCFVGGISINAFRQDVALTDLSGAVVATRRVTCTDLSDAGQTLVQCAEAFNRMVDETGVDRNRLLGCGFIATGAVDPDSLIIHSAPVLNWRQVNIRDIIGEAVGVQLHADNIPNAKNEMTHLFGVTRNRRNVLLVNVSLAVRASLLIDGNIARGKTFEVGAIDNLLMPSEHETGLFTLDQLAGGYAVLDKLGITGDAANARSLLPLLDDDSPDVSAAFFQAGRDLAYAVASINALLHPETVLISGPLVGSEAFCDGVRERCTELIGLDYVQDSLRCVTLSNPEAACSLAAVRSLGISAHNPASTLTGAGR